MCTFVLSLNHLKMPFTSRILILLALNAGLLSHSACRERPFRTEPVPEASVRDSQTVRVEAPVPRRRDTADAATIMARPEVPVLCYHRLLDISVGRSASDNIMSADLFRAEMKLLADSGYRTILPDQLRDHLLFGDSLPEKPVMITFDDGSVGHYTVAVPELEKYGFRGVFFIMTIATGKPGYLGREQIRAMSERGHVIASHTWDHKSILKYDSADWKVQLTGARNTLEEITGRPVVHFAYPFGIWGKEAIPGLKEAGYASAYILSTKRDDAAPLYTVRRMNVPGHWGPAAMLQAMRRTFAVRPAVADLRQQETAQ
jgi:peptidoglycan/xylan/chitin deacetylase (PgdA/CDA1 family)